MNNPQSASMYESEKKIYPREIGGRFDKLSKLATVVLLGLFYAVPWFNWDERQAVLFDLPARKFHLIGLTLWPQDFPPCAVAVFLHSARWTPVVWLRLPTDCLDRGLHLDGAVDRGNAFATHETRQGTVVLEQATPQRLEAVPVDYLLDVDGLYVRRVLHPGPRTRR
jgi:hypothetical protein